MAPSDASALVRRDLMVVTAGAGAVVVLGVPLCLVAPRLLPLSGTWTIGFTWGAILLAGLPASLISISCSRLVVIGGLQSILMWLALIFAAANALLDALLFWLLGPIGIPIATVIVRVVASACYGMVARNIWTSLINGTVGADEYGSTALISQSSAPSTR